MGFSEAAQATPLLLACQAGSVEVAELLLEARADPDKEGFGV